MQRPGIGNETVEFLAGRIDYERALAVPYDKREFRLERMRELLDRVGNPQQALRLVHVAGTKGKGSTAAMIAAVLSAAGYRAGLYSSPHLHCVEERLMIDGAICPADDFTDLVARVRPAVEAMDAASDSAGTNRPTYFEIITALALLRFALAGVDAAVLEVGLGGRLDSTNVCHPLVSVITSISFDHTHQLGPTLASIAREKAGIIKPGVPVVSGVRDEEPRAVIAEVAAAQGCRLVQLGRDFDFVYRPPRALERAAGNGAIDFTACGVGWKRPVADVTLALVGRHQAANAAVAMAALGELAAHGLGVPEAALRDGLANVRWPARLEILGRAPTVVLDAAHNVASIEALTTALAESFSARRRVLVFATTVDKDARGMLTRLLPRFDEVILTAYFSNPRGAPAEALAVLAAELSPREPHVCPDPASAWQRARALAGPEDLICVAGSIFIAAEMRQLIPLAHGRG